MPKYPKVLPWDEIEKLCKIDCTGEEIASFIGVCYDTLERACKRIYKQPLADYIREKRGAGNISLRRRQYKAAMDGNTTMLIWLGKNRLGQSDKAIIDNKSSDGSMSPKSAITLSREDIKEILGELDI